ncbi:hypothetical protein [Corynebacterium sp. HMSC04H06]|uniref:hypothetical protein n=1 Tax=Corynebacterium sp. HMSC04H06 TaxID=1581050 RepID=UPI0008A3078E|nr:hypothetical protein [Corynebacterium sp. HMSC04H06]OFS18999.1 hypothetical protein HMPREF3067_10520 [Corynebacterium sp. HMSC04H06]
MDELNVHSTEGFDMIESITPGENDKQVVIKFKQTYPWWQDTYSFLLPPQVDSAGEFDATGWPPYTPTTWTTRRTCRDSFGELISFDPEKAKQLLDDAGWAPGSDGTREKDGQPLALRYVLTCDGPGIKAEASATQKANQLEKEALANFGAKSLGSVEVENVGYVRE